MFRPIGVIGGGLAIPMAIVGSVALLLVLLCYVSIRLVPSGHDSIKEMSMVKTLKACSRILFFAVVENIGAAGVGVVAAHLSA